MIRAAAPFAIALAIAASPARGGDRVEKVAAVYDGDTITLAAVWTITPADATPAPLYDLGAVKVRLLAGTGGIDTPELAPRAACVAEHYQAMAARDFTAAMIAQAGGIVRLQRVRQDKFGGRMLADVQVKRGGRWLSIGSALIRARLAARYNGKGERGGWC